ncbi:hypothetical protein BYT27DRAFT_7225232 [Phlegmacium glaucopus]|nr:hypothetical protein BYT27DRAFT_7225232 [Phlegmacium glaucopus]
MLSEIVTPFHRDKEDENPEDFLRAFFRQMGNSSDDIKKAQFPNYLQADGTADDWFIDLDDNEKKTWADIQEAFQKRWPRKKQVKKTVEEYEEEILGQKIATEDLAKKEKIAGREVYSHIAWADKIAKSVKGAKLDKTTTYIRQVRKDLPNILQEKIGTGHEDWDVFLQAVRDIDIDHIRDSMDIWNKMQAEQKAIERRIQILETVLKSPTAPIQQQLSTVAISRQSSANATSTNNPFKNNGDGQGNLRFSTNPTTQHQNRPAFTNPRNPPTAKQKAELRALLSTIPHHPDTQAGRQAYQAQQTKWARTYRPNTRCFTCGQIGHLGSRSGEDCQALGYRMLHPNEQRWRSICARILKEPRNAEPQNTTNVHLLAINDYSTSWQDIQGNGEGPSK